MRESTTLPQFKTQTSKSQVQSLRSKQGGQQAKRLMGRSWMLQMFAMGILVALSLVAYVMYSTQIIITQEQEMTFLVGRNNRIKNELGSLQQNMANLTRTLDQLYGKAKRCMRFTSTCTELVDQATRSEETLEASSLLSMVQKMMLHIDEMNHIQKLYQENEKDIMELEQHVFRLRLENTLAIAYLQYIVRENKYESTVDKVVKEPHGLRIPAGLLAEEFLSYPLKQLVQEIQIAALVQANATAAYTPHTDAILHRIAELFPPQKT